MFLFELIIGPMFSGKSTELLRRISRFKAIGKNVLIINHIHDVRTEKFIQTHDKRTHKAVKSNYLVSLLNTKELLEADVIAIDEAQFFPDLKNFILEIENSNKIVYASGLDGDFRRNPIGQILECIPLCDNVTKLHSFDMISKDGSKGIFSKRLNKENNDTILIGGQDRYVAVNRKNYLNY